MNLEQFSPEKLSNFDLHEFRSYEINEKQVKPSTWNRRLASLTRFQDWCLEVGFIRHTVMDGIQRMDEVQLAPKSLQRVDYARFSRQVERNMNAAETESEIHKSERDAAMVGFMLEAGLREAEVLALVQDDVIIVEPGKGSQVHVRMGKGEKYRIVPLSAKARRLIKPWLERCKTDRLFVISSRTVQKRVKEIGRQADCAKDITPHMLRHTFGHHYYEKSKHNIVKTQAVMGHASFKTTVRYTWPSLDDLADVVEDM